MKPQRRPAPLFRLAIAGAEPLMRLGLRTALESCPGVQVRAEYGDAAQLLAARELTDLDLLAIDPDAFPISPLMLVRNLRSQAPTLPLLVFTGHRGETAVREMFQTGVYGYLTKAASPEALREAVEAVLDGRHYLDATIASIILGSLPRRIERRARPRTLTARERAILGLLAEGLRNQEMAERLSIAEATVKFHLHSVFRKLPARNRADAVRRALDIGLIQP